MQYFLLLVLLLIAGLFLLEILLRITGFYNTYFEKNFGYYLSYYNEDSIRGQVWVRDPNKTLKLSQEEFNYTRTTNELGLSYTEKTDSSKPLAIALGDSFTEGIGAPQDSTWSQLLETQLHSTNCSIQIYNAGVAGSDIFFMQKLYEEKLHLLNPDLLLLCINYSDISEYIFRGGKERFKEDGNTYFPDGPEWEVYYRNSHVVRFIAHFFLDYDFTLHKESQIYEMLPVMFEAFAQEIRWLKKHTNKLVLIIQPYPYFLDKDIPYHYAFEELIVHLPPDIEYINLYPVIEEFYVHNESTEFYWPKDGHFNSKGYLKMSQMIFEAMKEKQICNSIEQK